MKKHILLIIMVLALSVCLFACNSNDNGSEATASPSAASSAGTTTATAGTPTSTPDNTATTTAGTTTEDTTETPTAEPTAEPTAGPEMVANVPEYYVDFTDRAWDSDYISYVVEGTEVESGEYGLTITGTNDPYFTYVVPEPEMDPTEYKYMALRVKATRTDLVGQIRFGTENDDRAWAFINFNYADTEEWQTVVVAFADALCLEPTTLDGSCLTQFRFDPYDDASDIGNVIKEGEDSILESVAFFKTPEEAAAFAGLYVYPEVVE